MAQTAQERNANTWERRAAVDAWCWRLVTWPRAGLGSRDCPTVLQNVLMRNCGRGGAGWKSKEQAWANQPGQAAPGPGTRGSATTRAAAHPGERLAGTMQTPQVPTFMMVMFQGLVPTKRTRTTS